MNCGLVRNTRDGIADSNTLDPPQHAELMALKG